MSLIFDSVMTGSFSIGTYLLCLLVAGLCGAITALALRRESTASRSFLISLVVLPIIVTTVVRFRSAAGKARDITAIFLVMTAGLACAAGYIAAALLFTVVASALMAVLSRVPMRCERSLELHVTVPESLHFADAFDDLFRQYAKTWKLVKAKTSNMGSLYKLDYKIELKEPAAAQEFLDALRCRNGNLEIALLYANEGGDEL